MSTAVLTAARSAPAAQPARPALAKSGEISIPFWLIALLILTIFLPRGVDLRIGTAEVSPQRLVSMVLLPWMLIATRAKLNWIDLIVPLGLTSSIVSMQQSGTPTVQIIETSGRTVLDSWTLYVLGRTLPMFPETLRKAMTWLVWVMIVLLPTVILEGLTGFNPHVALWKSIFPAVSAPAKTEVRYGVIRAFAWSGHPIMVGFTYLAVLSVALHAAFERNRLVGAFPWVKAALLMVGSVFSMSSGAIVTVALLLAFYVYDYGLMMLRVPAMTRWLAVWVGGPTLWIIADMASGRPLLRILMMNLHMSSSLAWHYRWKLLERVWNAMPGYWWFGHGTATPPSFSGYARSVDNQYMAVLLTGGMVAMVIFIARMVLPLFFGGRAVWLGKDSAEAKLGRAFGLVVLAYALGAISVAIFSTAGSMLGFFVGLTIGQAQAIRLGFAGGQATDDAVEPAPESPEIGRRPRGTFIGRRALADAGRGGGP
ncbi:MAG: hypothetical protein AAGB29_05055 [Planctomycetota bacterium]